MYESDKILEAAKSVRPYLVELVGRAVAGDMDERLAKLLADAVRGRKVDNMILEAVQSYPPVRDWIRTYLQGGVTEALRLYEPLPGVGDPVSAPRFCCPHGDYVWHRREVGEPIPVCPTHAVELTSC